MSEQVHNPNDPIDQLSIEVNRLRQENDALSKRLVMTEKAVQELLTHTRTSIELQELVITRVLHKFFDGLTHSLEHSITAAQTEYMNRKRGFEIRVVDGIEEKETPHSIIVTKNEDGTYDFAASSTPDKIDNSNTERFVDFLNHEPQLFESSNQILINIYAHTEHVKAVEEQLNEQQTAN
ncbi:hypothetical protein AVT69_gp058 [Pseudomonas phage PhiPA3]|uniref:Uncharacterized protein 057 n=1 Tax=Pseudomonas phage PhiPA3 TaxID=998086 RepID=F8SJT9_BPPA3|nr:hypothetical protein AVT69_gp058 [Pseudomonas phage PhiPA3]AEH03484.1 hypothetical protein [Pseudomonas phage PhiPA3]